MSEEKHIILLPQRDNEDNHYAIVHHVEQRGLDRISIVVLGDEAQEAHDDTDTTWDATVLMDDLPDNARDDIETVVEPFGVVQEDETLERVKQALTSGEIHPESLSEYDELDLIDVTIDGCTNMTDTRVRDENGTLAVSIRQHVRDDVDMDEGEPLEFVGEPGVFVALSEDQLSLETRRAIEDAVREIVRDD